MIDVLLVGGGIGGLTAALELHRRGIRGQVVEASPAFAELGVGLNVLPHASARLAALGLQPALDAAAIRTKESVFYSRFGQLIHREPCGLAAGFDFPQYSVHRADLHRVLLDAVRERLGPDAVLCGHRVIRFEQIDSHVTVHLDGRAPMRARVIIGCDGIHSAVRAQLYPGNGALRYSGVNMWRGVTVAAPFLSGASMMRGGWFPTGKLVCYPIRDNVDGDGNQLINWVVEVETPEHLGRAWNRRGRLDDFAHRFEAWRFPWLDVPKLLAGAPEVLEYPMVDQDPLPRWSFGRVSLLGDAAHPMLPRGSNGAGQSILDAEALADSLAARPDDVPEALRVYEAARLPATSKVVLANRENPPDAILREVYLRSGDKPFDRIEDIIDPAEMTTMTAGYGKLAAAGRLAGSAGVGDPAMEVKADAARHSHVTGV